MALATKVIEKLLPLGQAKGGLFALPNIDIPEIPEVVDPTHPLGKMKLFALQARAKESAQKYLEEENAEEVVEEVQLSLPGEIDEEAERRKTQRLQTEAEKAEALAKARAEKAFRMQSLSSDAKRKRLERARQLFGANNPVLMDDPDPEPLFAERACFCMTLQNKYRLFFIDIVQTDDFNNTVIIAILLNCVALAMYDPMDKECTSMRCIILVYAEYAFTGFFFLEMCIKMIAQGVFIGRGTYLTSGWNRLDFVVVMSSIVNLVPYVDIGNISLLRVFRVMRPLRAISRFPGVRVLVSLLLDTMPMLQHICVLITCVFFLFSIIGSQLWQGILRKRCVDPTNGGVYEPDPEEPYYCSVPGEAFGNGCGMSATINNGTANVTYVYTECRDAGDNPGAGVINFDNALFAWITIFQVITCEDWVAIMYMVMEAYSEHVWLYFVPLVFLGMIHNVYREMIYKQ